METIKKYAVMLLLIAWGAISFLALCSETVTSLSSFILIKVAAVASLALCIKVAKIADKHQWV